jgi:hypothetical protein
VGRLRVRADGAGLGQHVTARLRAQTLIASLDLAPPGLADRAVLVVRRAEWRAGRQLAATARATLDELRRTAVRPAHAPALGPGAEAVLFADDAELLSCMTRDALTGQLTRWYWRQLAPARMGRIGAVLAAAWTARVRWLPAALACLSAGDAVRAAATLTPAEAAGVRRALMAEFAGPIEPAWPSAESAWSPGPQPLAGGQGGQDEPGAAIPGHQGTVARAGPGRFSGAPSAGPAAPWTPWLGASPQLPPEQEALLGVAIALHAHPVQARRPAFLAAVEAWLSTPSRPPAPTLAGQGAGAAAAPVAADTAPDAAGSSAGSADHTVSPTEGTAGEGLVVIQVPARPDSALVTVAPEAGPSAPATWTGATPSQFASVLYLINLLGWLDLPGVWPEEAAPGGWAVIELLARHLLSNEAAPPNDPLWALLAVLDGREPGVAAEAGTGPDDPLRLPAGWLRRWVPPEPSWEWAEWQGRLVIADPERDFVIADVPCAAGQGATAAVAELARLRAAGVSGSLSPAPPSRRTAGARGLTRWRGTVGQFAAWLLDSREVRSSALSRPGLVSVTRTHVDVILDLEDVDMAARVSGLDRNPGWVPDLGRIVTFHFRAED